MRGLDSKGEWRIPFNPRASTHRNDDYCEGTAWQWTWFVPHDVDGLVNLMGGEDAFAQKLDSLFTADSSLEGETTSSDISGLRIAKRNFREFAKRIQFGILLLKIRSNLTRALELGLA